MLPTFTNLPEKIADAIATTLLQEKAANLYKASERLHTRYTTKEKMQNDRYIESEEDALAYLGLRVPATYAQIYGTLTQLQEVLPSWHPTTLLDIGSGPSTAVWATKLLFPSITDATSIDQEEHFISLGKAILEKAEISLNMTWRQQNAIKVLENDPRTYDLIIIANVLNEMEPKDRERILKLANDRCRGILVIIEPGTPDGFAIVQKTAQKLSPQLQLLAPYIENTFVESNEYFIHFPQRFIRPEFQRRIRQQMRESTQMASDWEETKYAYVAFGKNLTQEHIWGRTIGKVTKQKGFLTIPVLTKDGIVHMKVMKREKEKYTQMKHIRWGEIIRENISS